MTPAELRALHAKATAPDATLMQLADLEIAAIDALPALLDVADELTLMTEACSNCGGTGETINKTTTRVLPCPRCHNARTALAKLETP